MKINIIKTLSGWEPFDSDGHKYHRRFNLNDVYSMDVTRFQDQRNIKLNSKYWKMLSVIIENTDKYRKEEELHIIIKKCLGIIEEIYNPKTRENDIVVGSTSFLKMSEDDFRQFYQDAVTFCCRYIVTGTTEQEINDRVNQLLPFF